MARWSLTERVLYISAECIVLRHRPVHLPGNRWCAVSQTVTVTLVVDDSLPVDDGGMNNLEEALEDASESDLETEGKASVLDEPVSALQEVTNSDPVDARPYETAVGLMADLQAIMRRAFSSRTLEQDLEAAWVNTERNLNQSTAANRIGRIPTTLAWTTLRRYDGGAAQRESFVRD